VPIGGGISKLGINLNADGLRDYLFWRKSSSR
jgi:hypothetical protein